MPWRHLFTHNSSNCYGMVSQRNSDRSCLWPVYRRHNSHISVLACHLLASICPRWPLYCPRHILPPRDYPRQDVPTTRRTHISSEGTKIMGLDFSTSRHCPPLSIPQPSCSGSRLVVSRLEHVLPPHTYSLCTQSTLPSHLSNSRWSLLHCPWLRLPCGHFLRRPLGRSYGEEVDWKT